MACNCGYRSYPLIILLLTTHEPPSAVSFKPESLQPKALNKDTENSDDESEKPNKRKDVSSPWAAASKEFLSGLLYGAPIRTGLGSRV